MNKDEFYISLRVLSRVLGWSKNRTLRWGKREKVLLFRGGQWVTTRSLLAAHVPELWEQLEAEDMREL